MRIQELREDEPLKVVEVSQHIKRPTFYFEETSDSDLIEIKQIQMKVFTDGEIIRESEEVSESIEEYYIGKKKYEPYVDTLKTKIVFFKNHSYVITYLIAQECTTVGNIRGWFDIINDVSIYLKNPKDKKALRNAKQAIREIQNHNSSVNYSSLFTMLFSQTRGFEQFKSEKMTENIYSLKRTKNK